MPSSAWGSTSAGGTATPVTTPLAPTTSVTTLNNDDILSRAKKPALITDYNAELQIQSYLVAQATTLGVSHSAYDAAVATLTGFLQGLGGTGPAWNFLDVTTDTGMGTGGGATLRTYWQSVALNRAALGKANEDKIQANAAYSDALARSSNNLIKNGNCEQTTPPPTGYEAAGVAVGGAYTGTKSVHIAPNVGWAFFDKANVPCVGGDQFRFEAIVYNNTTNQCLLAMEWYAADGSVISETSTPVYSTTGAWNILALDGTAPGSAASVGFRVQAYSSSAGTSNTYFDNLYACRKISAGMLEADLALLGVVRSPNYSPGTDTAGPVGYKQSGAGFPTTYIGGATDPNCHFELEGTANFGGYKAATVADQSMNAMASFTGFSGATTVSVSGGRMMGLGVYATPKNTGRLLIMVSGQWGVSGASCMYSLCYGTGTKPNTNDAGAGTQAGGSRTVVIATLSPFSRSIIIEGLAKGTQYWFDLLVDIMGTGSITMQAGMDMVVIEI